MIQFILLAGALGLLTAAWLTHPLWRRPLPHPAGEPAPGSRAVLPRSSWGMACGLTVFVGVTAAGGYAWLGSPTHLSNARIHSPSQSSEVSPSAAQVAALVQGLAERLKAQPDDAQGWAMLARSYAVLGQHAAAADAFRKAASLRPDDADLLVDFAVALALANQRRLDGEPTALIERALKAQPKNPRVLALAGMAAFDRGDHRAAIVHWQALQQVEPADGPIAKQIAASLGEARRLAGISALAR